VVQAHVACCVRTHEQRDVGNDRDHDKYE
jgi:hypothetical protein